jgi:hypothetical protein
VKKCVVLRTTEHKFWIIGTEKQIIDISETICGTWVLINSLVITGINIEMRENFNFFLEIYEIIRSIIQVDCSQAITEIEPKKLFLILKLLHSDEAWNYSKKLETPIELEDLTLVQRIIKNRELYKSSSKEFITKSELERSNSKLSSFSKYSNLRILSLNRDPPFVFEQFYNDYKSSFDNQLNMDVCLNSSNQIETFKLKKVERKFCEICAQDSCHDFFSHKSHPLAIEGFKYVCKREGCGTCFRTILQKARHQEKCLLLKDHQNLLIALCEKKKDAFDETLNSVNYDLSPFKLTFNNLKSYFPQALDKLKKELTPCLSRNCLKTLSRLEEEKTILSHLSSSETSYKYDESRIALDYESKQQQNFRAPSNPKLLYGFDGHDVIKFLDSLDSIPQKKFAKAASHFANLIDEKTKKFMHPEFRQFWTFDEGQKNFKMRLRQGCYEKEFTLPENKLEDHMFSGSELIKRMLKLVGDKKYFKERKLPSDFEKYDVDLNSIVEFCSRSETQISYNLIWKNVGNDLFKNNQAGRKYVKLFLEKFQHESEVEKILNTLENRKVRKLFAPSRALLGITRKPSSAKAKEYVAKLIEINPDLKKEIYGEDFIVDQFKRGKNKEDVFIFGKMWPLRATYENHFQLLLNEFPIFRRLPFKELTISDYSSESSEDIHESSHEYDIDYKTEAGINFTF